MREPLIVGFTAGADLSSAEGYVVKRSGANIVKATDGTIAGGEIILGIIPLGGGGASGDRVSVVVEGPTLAKCGGVLTRGTHQFLSVNGSGKLVAASAGDVIVAEWIDDGSDAAAADGDLIPVRVCKQQFVDGLALSNVIRADLSAAAEAADTIAVTVNMVDGAGNALNAQHDLICQLYDANMVESVATAHRMAETGAGSAVSATAQARMIIRTDANGDATITVTDVAGASNTTVTLEVRPMAAAINQVPVPSYVRLTFDNA
jgi:hypothetical protein